MSVWPLVVTPFLALVVALVVALAERLVEWLVERHFVALSLVMALGQTGRKGANDSRSFVLKAACTADLSAAMPSRSQT